MVKRKSSPKKKTPLKEKNRKSRKSDTPRKRAPVTSITVSSKTFRVFRTTMKAIKQLQNTVDNCIPRLPFSRLIREILMEHTSHETRIQLEALKALQEAAEIYLTYLFEDANKCALHARRITVMPKDLNLVLEIRGCNDPGYS